MSNLKMKLINILLKKDGLVAVPSDWDEDFVSLNDTVVKLNNDYKNVVEKFNKLLESYYSKITLIDLREEANRADIKIKTTSSREEISEKLCKEFKIEIE